MCQNSDGAVVHRFLQQSGNHERWEGERFDVALFLQEYIMPLCALIKKGLLEWDHDTHQNHYVPTDSCDLIRCYWWCFSCWNCMSCCCRMKHGPPLGQFAHGTPVRGSSQVVVFALWLRKYTWPDDDRRVTSPAPTQAGVAGVSVTLANFSNASEHLRGSHPMLISFNLQPSLT